ncbi:MAG TPA: aspartate/glutamate racemase family protein [Desulfobacterales bacterium]|nr:aspartate/glutamate racemase family protein [Desulfobacterales bacterium]
MNHFNHKDYGYISKGDDDWPFYIRKGQFISGYTVGILHLEVWYPLLPGNVVNADTYDFPVRHKLIPNATQSRVHGGDPTLLDDIIRAGKELEKEGVRAICGACGYLGNFQAQVVEALDVPVFLSSLIQLPAISIGLQKDQKVGVLCADGPSMSSEIIQNCGADPSRCIVKGLEDQPQMAAIVKSDRGSFDNAALKREIVEGALNLVRKHPEIGALLLECSDMPPYAAEVQRAIKLPVYDFVTLIKWVHNSVAQKPYYGFL